MIPTKGYVSFRDNCPHGQLSYRGNNHPSALLPKGIYFSNGDHPKNNTSTLSCHRLKPPYYFKKIYAF